MSLGQSTELEYDMVMLNQAAVPQPDAETIGSVLNITQSPGGWFMEYHPKLRPMDSPTDGVFLAGACQGVKDIPSIVAQGSAAAARAVPHGHRGIPSASAREDHVLFVHPFLSPGRGLAMHLPYYRALHRGRNTRSVLPPFFHAAERRRVWHRHFRGQ